MGEDDVVGWALLINSPAQKCPAGGSYLGQTVQGQLCRRRAFPSLLAQLGIAGLFL